LPEIKLPNPKHDKKLLILFYVSQFIFYYENNCYRAGISLNFLSVYTLVLTLTIIWPIVGMDYKIKFGLYKNFKTQTITNGKKIFNCTSSGSAASIML